MLRRITSQLVGSILFLLLAGVAFAEKGDMQHLLKGTYGVIGTETCVTTDGEILPPPGLEFFGNPTKVTGVVNGTITFDGNGGTVSVYQNMNVSDGPFFPGSQPIGTATGTCEGTYLVNRDRSFSSKASCAFKIVDGAGGGFVEGNITGYEYEGFIAPNGHTAIASITRPVVQEIVLADGFNVRRICAQTNTYVRIK